MKSWNIHYTRQKSHLRYPDENLVRLISRKIDSSAAKRKLRGIDIGCGSGRHLKLLADLGIPQVVGIDISFNALSICHQYTSASLLQGNNLELPIKNDSADVIIAWGSLHYGEKESLPPMLNEIKRIMVKNGHLFATLRSSRDTYLKGGKNLGNDTWITSLKDIQGSVVSFYSEKELIREFSIFHDIEYGLIERSSFGDINTVISHWVLHAVK